LHGGSQPLCSCTWLLWRGSQYRCHGECGWKTNGFLLDLRACREKTKVTRPVTEKYSQKANKEIASLWHCLVGTYDI
jgi:hypothetical protein